MVAYSNYAFTMSVKRVNERPNACHEGAYKCRYSSINLAQLCGKDMCENCDKTLIKKFAIFTEILTTCHTMRCGFDFFRVMSDKTQLVSKTVRTTKWNRNRNETVSKQFRNCVQTVVFSFVSVSFRCADI